ncbi:LacI family DNA-binding transcriptional regulator [Anaerolentibacter hominis]|uniref:LacI family DNA-binding transcriptional regulator n=1 Tax=Anaerolentibacter hominis TaxID=3079009 RepID=UPI0031B87F12
MTLKEIAKEAGVSVSTVSRVINKKTPSPASKEVQDKIWSIVRRTGYRPNVNARSLKMGTAGMSASSGTRTLACIFARSGDATSDPFFSQIARAMEAEAYGNNYILKYSFSVHDIAAPDLLRQMKQDQADGVVILGRFKKQLLKDLSQTRQPVLYAGLNNIDSAIDQITCNGYDASLQAMDYLWQLGHRRIAYLGETSHEVRFKGYQEFLARRKSDVGPSFIVNTEQTAEGGYYGACRLLEQTKTLTAVFCANDMTAIGAMRAMKDMGREVPKDISIIGIDDIDLAQYVSPLLTTVHIPLDEIGKQAARTLIDRIEGGHKLPMKVELPFYIVKRQSCRFI